MPPNISYDYSVVDNNDTATEYTLIVEFINEKYEGDCYVNGTTPLTIQMYRARRSTPYKRRQIYVAFIPEHNGVQ